VLEQLVPEAEAHAVLPAVVRNLPKFVEGPEYASAMKDALRRRVVMFGLSAMLRHHGDVLLAATRDLPVAIVKGRTFARAIYPEPVLRSFTDIDLLVAPSALPRVTEVLQAEGFKFAEAGHDPERLEAKWVHTNNPVLLVEVHTNLVHHPGLRRAMSLSYDDLGGETDAYGSLLTIACLHGALHQFERLQQVVDICQAARALGTAEEEARFERLLIRTGGRLAAIAGLDLAARLFADRRCTEIARALGPERYRGLSRLLISPTVVGSTKSAQRSFYSWRRKAFRDLLKRRRNSETPADLHAAP
jgi:hypothetical protein